MIKNVRIGKIRKESDNCYLILSPYGKLLQINYIGKLVIEGLKDNEGLDSIAEKVSLLNTGLNQDDILNDIISFIEQLKLCGIVE